MTSFAPTQRQGFILLEVIFALAVFGIAATGFAVALHKMADVASLAQSELRITRILQSSLDEAVSTPTMEEGKNTGSLAERISDSPVEITTEIKLMQDGLQNQDGTQLQNMYDIIVTARWFANGQSQERSAETWRYGNMYQP